MGWVTLGIGQVGMESTDRSDHELQDAGRQLVAKALVLGMIEALDRTFWHRPKPLRRRRRWQIA